jgi:hypothetical protein
MQTFSFCYNVFRFILFFSSLSLERVLTIIYLGCKITKFLVHANKKKLQKKAKTAQPFDSQSRNAFIFTYFGLGLVRVKKGDKKRDFNSVLTFRRLVISPDGQARRQRCCRRHMTRQNINNLIIH